VVTVNSNSSRAPLAPAARRTSLIRANSRGASACTVPSSRSSAVSRAATSGTSSPPVALGSTGSASPPASYTATPPFAGVIATGRRSSTCTRSVPGRRRTTRALSIIGWDATRRSSGASSPQTEVIVSTLSRDTSSAAEA
jgi:hypothetical protein